jgi:methyltransferase family protein
MSHTANGFHAMPQIDAVSPGLRDTIEQLLESIPVDTGGGASPLKALVLADLIITQRLQCVVEIGVYRGRLLLPLALTAKSQGAGEVIGIDPYSAQAAEQHDEHASPLDLKAWPHAIDWDGLYAQINRAIADNGAERWCRVMRTCSEDSAHQFPTGTIDLLHIDGNHDQASVIRDVELYVPKVKVGGYVVLDDTSWASVWPVYRQLQATHELVFHLFDCHGISMDGMGGNDFAIFRILD